MTSRHFLDMCNRLKNKEESGRTMLEIIAVLSILTLLTIGGSKGYGWIRTNAITNDVVKNVLDLAINRRNNQLERNYEIPERPEIVTRKGVGGIPVSVENGLNGSLEDIFWVTVGSLEQKVSKPVCEALLEKRSSISSNALPLLATSFRTDNKLVNGPADCEDENIIRFYFPKRGGNASSGGAASSNIPTIEIEEGTEKCPTRLCPEGASCVSNSIVCLPGYKMVGSGTCQVACQACSGGTYNNEADTTNSECHTCEPGKTSQDGKTCACMNEGDACTMFDGRSGYVRKDGNSCNCVECTNDEHCQDTCHICGTDNICEEIEEEKECPDCTGVKKCWSSQLSECVLCPGACETDANCGENETCNTDTNLCECPNDFYIVDGACVACPEGQNSLGPNATECGMICSSSDDCYGGQYCNNKIGPSAGICRRTNGLCADIGGSSSIINIEGFGKVLVSNNKMNGTSAGSWCEAKGYSLLSFNDLPESDDTLCAPLREHIGSETLWINGTNIRSINTCMQYYLDVGANGKATAHKAGLRRALCLVRKATNTCEGDEDCGENETCNTDEGMCECPIGFHLVDGACVACPEGQNSLGPNATECGMICSSSDDCYGGQYCNNKIGPSAGICRRTNGLCADIGGSSSIINIEGFGKVLVSNNKMNGTSAGSWCEAKGYSLLSFNDLPESDDTLCAPLREHIGSETLWINGTNIRSINTCMQYYLDVGANGKATAHKAGLRRALCLVRKATNTCEGDEDCGENETCNTDEGMCECPIGFHLVDGECLECPEGTSSTTVNAESC